MAQVGAEKADLSTVSFAAEFFTQHQGQEVLNRLVLRPIPPDASSVEKDLSPPKGPLGPVLDGNGDVSSQSQAAPRDPMANILAAITGLESKLSAGQDRMAAQLATLAMDTEGLANKVNRMGNKFEQEVQKIYMGQKRQFDALDQWLKRLESGSRGPPHLALAASHDNGQSIFPLLSDSVLSTSGEGSVSAADIQRVQKSLGVSNPAQFTEKLVLWLLTDGNVHLQEFLPRSLVPSSEST